MKSGGAATDSNPVAGQRQSECRMAQQLWWPGLVSGVGRQICLVAEFRAGYSREISADDPQGRQELREQRSRPIMANLRDWRDENNPQVRPRSSIDKAIGYMNSEWPRLCVFLDAPAVATDNNEAERYPARATDDRLSHNCVETRARMDSALGKTG